MQSEVSISVVIPTFNSGRFVSAAIDSALSQSFRPLEVIVVDDGSTDATVEVLQRYDDRIHVHRQPNQGVSAARNAGIERARGTHVAFLDADDIWLPGKLAAQAAAFALQPSASLVHVGVLEVEEDGVTVRRPRSDGMRGDVAAELVLLRSVVLGGGSGLAVPRALLQRIGGFDTRLSTAADWDIFLRLALQGPVEFVEQPLLKYRFPGNQMHRNVRAMEHDLLHVLDRAFGELGMPEHLRRPAYGRAHRVLAGSFLEAGQRRRALVHGIAALRADPALRQEAVRMIVRRLKRRRMTAPGENVNR